MVVDAGPETVNLRFGSLDNMLVLSIASSEEVDEENDTDSARLNEHSKRPATNEGLQGPLPRSLPPIIASGD